MYRGKIKMALEKGIPFKLGLTTFNRGYVDDKIVLQGSNWHNTSSVIASWGGYNATDIKSLLMAIYKNRKHYRKPFPKSEYYQKKGYRYNLLNHNCQDHEDNQGLCHTCGKVIK